MRRESTTGAARGPARRRHILRHVVLVIVTVAAATVASWSVPAATPPAAAVVTDVSVRAVAQGIAHPYGITTGGDGNVWFTNVSGESIARITPSGSVTHFRGEGIRSPRGIVAGPDGNVWFTNDGLWTFETGRLPGGIGRITPDGSVTVFTDPALTYPTDVTAGPDGNLWFTNTDEYRPSIGRITPAGTITIFTGPDIRVPLRITGGPDLNVWFTDHAAAAIGRITPDGAVTTFQGAGPMAPGEITAGPDGNLWFRDGFNKAIVRITPAGAISSYTAPDVGGNGDITAGPDGNLWFTNPGTPANAIGRISTTGVISTSPSPGTGSVEQISAGPDGNLWFTVPGLDRVGRITVDGARTTFEGNRIRGPRGLATGEDGNVWFLNAHGQIGRITPDGAVTNFSSPDSAFLGEIASGPDGNVWFTGNTMCPGPGDDPTVCGAVGRITPSGEITLFRTGPRTTEDITAGPDGNLWFTDDLGSVLRITPTGAVTSFPAPGFKRTASITAGPDGSLWFVDRSWDAKVGRMTPTGEVTTFTHPSFGFLEAITAGPDGAVWVTGLNGSIGRITADGNVSSFPTGANATDISAGPDGNLWFTDPDADTIGRMTPAGIVSTFRDPSINLPNRIAPGPDGNMWFTAGNSLIGSMVTGLPGPPRDVVAKPASGAAVVTWSAPASEGSSPVSGYSVTASPGGHGCTWSSGPLTCTVAGLASGTSYTFTVVASNGAGRGAPSARSNAVVPTDEVAFHPVSPARILDSRPAGPRVGAYGTPWGAGQARDVAVTGVGGVPAGARAVVANITVTGTTTAGFLTIWPAGQPRPLASSVNWSAGRTVANGVTVMVGDAGTVSVFNQAGAADVIIDVVGYYDANAGDGLTPLTPIRISDSRLAPGAPLGAAQVRDVAVTGTGGVPAGADAVVANVTVTGTTSTGYLTIWPAGQPRPVASSLNWSAGQTVANAVTVKVGAGGKVSVFNAAGSAHVVVDVVGTFSPGSGHLFHPLPPARIQDSRPAGPQVGPYATPWGHGAVRDLQVAGAGGVPASAAAALLNVTVTATTASSYLTIVPAGTSAVASSLNWQPGQTVANGVTAKLGAGGRISVGNATGSAHVVADVAGWYG